MEQLLLALQVAQVVARAEQGEHLLPGAGAVLGVEDKALQGVLDAVGGAGLDQHVALDGGHLLLAAVAEHFNNERDVAEADDVVLAEGVLAIEKGAVGAAQIADAPAGGRVLDLGMPAADRAVIQHDLQRGQPAGPQDRFALPELALNLAVDAAELNVSLHAPSPSVPVPLRTIQKTIAHIKAGGNSRQRLSATSPPGPA